MHVHLHIYMMQSSNAAFQAPRQLLRAYALFFAYGLQPLLHEVLVRDEALVQFLPSATVSILETEL